MIYACFCFPSIGGWFKFLPNAVPPNSHSSIQQQARLLFTFPWRMGACFLFKIMYWLCEVKFFIGIKYFEWQNDFNQWEGKSGTFYPNSKNFSWYLDFLFFLFPPPPTPLVFEAWLQTGTRGKILLCSHKTSLLASKSKEIWTDI